MAANIAALRSRAPANPALARYEEIARLLTAQPSAQADAGVAWLTRLVSDLQVSKLASYGLAPSHIPDLVQNSQNASSMKANPIALTDQELSAVMAAVI
jgi:alcohol dehydrogenase class IV